MLKQIIESPVKDKDDKYIHIGNDTLFKDVIEVKRSLFRKSLQKQHGYG